MSKRIFHKITFADSGVCICESLGEVEAMTEGYSPGEFSVEEVEMTDAEYEALPDFEG